MKEHTFNSAVLNSVIQRLNDAEIDDNQNYECLGHYFKINKGVFPPTHFQSTGIFTRLIPYPKEGRFLEIGSGAGVTAVIAALSGCAHVVATDISEAAVQNTRMNVEKHGVEHIVSIQQSDLFNALSPEDKFDAIFWNSNFIFVPEGFLPDKEILNAFCDVGYATHHRFFKEVKNHLAPGGKLLLGFSSQGDISALTELLNQYGYKYEIIASEFGVGVNKYQYSIMELVPVSICHQEGI